MTLTNFPNGITSFGVPVLGALGGIPFTGNYYFVDPVNGLDGNSGFNPDRALKSLYKAHSLAKDGNNDVVLLIGNGQSSGTARLSLAAAQSVDSTVTAGTLVWSKNATHLVGVAAPSMYAQRARIAPPTGVYTQATFGSGNFVVVTGGGCFFQNFSLFNGFSTGGVNQICWTDKGSRNAYVNVAFGGLGDAASAGDAGSRSLKIGLAGSGENYFGHCTIGLDTVQRGAFATASIEFAGGTPRNTFEDCILPMWTSSATPLFIVGTGASCVDRGNVFKRCTFVNDIKSGSTAVSEVLSFTNAAPGGLIGFLASTKIGATKWGDTNGLANCYIDMAAPDAATGGTGTTPT